MYDKLFSERLLLLRQLKGCSAREMSLDIGQNAGYIKDIESGKALPSMTGFFYICDYLNISPKDFFDTGSTAPEQLNSLIADLKKLDAKQLDTICNLVKTLIEK